MPRLKNREVLTAGLTGPQLLWEIEGFALANGVDSDGVYHGLVLPSDNVPLSITDATLIVKPERAKSQRDKGSVAAGEPGEGRRDAPDGTEPVVGGPTTPEPPGSEPIPSKTRYFGSKELASDKIVADFKKVYDEILTPLAAVDGVTLKVTVEIEAIRQDGLGDGKIRTVSDNARELKFGQSGFETS